jgi:hypothetical protein
MKGHSMEIMVETFEQTETQSDLQVEKTDEAITIIEQLGLKGQQTLLSPNEVVERVPYREMTSRERNVYQTLYSTVTQIEEYKAGFIPLRVLQIAAHAKSLNVYGTIEVWSEEGQPTDPVLVGRFGNDRWSAPRHILARWGTALEPFEKLYKMAIVKKMESLKAESQRKMAECQQVLASLEAHAIQDLR